MWQNGFIELIDDTGYSIDIDPDCLDYIIIISHPLSDLTKEIEHNSERFVPIAEIERLFHIGISYREFTNRIWLPVSENKYIIHYQDDGMVDLDIMLYFNVILKLIEWHFDIAGLIEKGEAVDVNTLPENPYK